MTEKYLLRQLGREFLPLEVWQRPKRPYRAPIHKSFFSQPTPDYVRDLLSAEGLKSTGLFRPGAIGQLVSKVRSGLKLGETDDMGLAGILSTQLLHHQFVSNFREVKPLSDSNDIKMCGPALAAAS
jgi:asparagine synthase (glutamine-hydrolysing)